MCVSIFVLFVSCVRAFRSRVMVPEEVLPLNRWCTDQNSTIPPKSMFGCPSREDVLAARVSLPPSHSHCPLFTLIASFPSIAFPSHSHCPLPFNCLSFSLALPSSLQLPFLLSPLTSVHPSVCLLPFNFLVFSLRRVCPSFSLPGSVPSSSCLLCPDPTYMVLTHCLFFRLWSRHA